MVWQRAASCVVGGSGWPLPYHGAAAPRVASGPAFRDPCPSGSLTAGYLAPIGWLGHVCRAVGSLWIALAEGDCMKAYAAVLMAAGLAPMNEKVTRLAVAVSASAMQQGNTTLADLTQLMLSARSQVLAEMIPGRQQIGAGCGHPGPSAEAMPADSLFSEWVLFWQKAFRVAVMKDLN